MIDIAKIDKEKALALKAISNHVSDQDGVQQEDDKEEIATKPRTRSKNNSTPVVDVQVELESEEVVQLKGEHAEVDPLAAKSQQELKTEILLTSINKRLALDNDCDPLAIQEISENGGNEEMDDYDDPLAVDTPLTDDLGDPLYIQDPLESLKENIIRENLLESSLPLDNEIMLLEEIDVSCDPLGITGLIKREEGVKQENSSGILTVAEADLLSGEDKIDLVQDHVQLAQKPEALNLKITAVCSLTKKDLGRV